MPNIRVIAVQFACCPRAITHARRIFDQLQKRDVKVRVIDRKKFGYLQAHARVPGTGDVHFHGFLYQQP
jgi:hypothetical protein